MKTIKEKKIRADNLLISKNYFEDIEEARKYILCGKIRIGNDRVIKNSSELLAENVEFNIVDSCPYVSRGAYKLLPALDKYLPDLNGKVGLDVGSSTGGFTDLMLQKGALKVYAVDSGTGQLHYKLREDPRVISMEKTNARHFNKDSLPEKVNIMTMDVSFISVTKILPALSDLFLDNSFGFILIKPQFELPREKVGQGGVVRSEEFRLQSVNKVKCFINENFNWKIIDLLSSPIKGPKGNQEYILCVKINF
jgi:23S rRNA (cytidine1920-2'-O)/16S rRNA (cytidine1409-2'-O)-methyltransferase